MVYPFSEVLSDFHGLESFLIEMFIGLERSLLLPIFLDEVLAFYQ